MNDNLLEKLHLTSLISFILCFFVNIFIKNPDTRLAMGIDLITIVYILVSLFKKKKGKRK